MSSTIITFWVTVFDLPHGVAPTTTPCPAATNRKPGDHEFTRQDHDDHPERHDVLAHQNRKYGDHEDLVSKWIEELAELGDELAAPRDASVERVRCRRPRVDGDTDLVVVCP